GPHPPHCPPPALADAHCVPPAVGHAHPVDPCEIGYNRSPHSRSPPVTTSWLLPAVTAPGTASLHLLLAHQARPLYSLALVHPFFLASSSEAAVFLFLIERMRLSLSPHPQNSVIAPLDQDVT